MPICTIGMVKKIIARSADHQNIPESRLWVHVIIRAVDDWQASKRLGRPGSIILAYFNSPSFHMHCDLAGINPEFVRECLAKVDHEIPVKNAKQA